MLVRHSLPGPPAGKWLLSGLAREGGFGSGSPNKIIVMYVDSSLPGTGSLVTLFNQLVRRSKFLSESFEP